MTIDRNSIMSEGDQREEDRNIDHDEHRNLASENMVDINRISKQNKILFYLETNDKLALKTETLSEGGLLNLDNNLRLKVWFKLADVVTLPLFPLSHQQIKKNEFYRQVILDVDRSLKRFPPSVHETKRIAYQDLLTNMIIRVLYHNPSLHYYQGYHDICLTFLLMMDEESAFQMVNRISNTHLCYFMEDTMQTTCNHLQIIYLIVSQEDPDLHDYLIRSEVGTIFCLSWVITWFSHVLPQFDDITRLFDCFISSHFLMPIYLTISILLYKSQAIRNIDCDMASMHQFLTNIPQKEKLPFDRLISDSLHLSIKYPPYDTLGQQNEIRQIALRGESKSEISRKSFNFLRQNVFSITFAVLVGALIYELYSDYSA